MDYCYHIAISSNKRNEPYEFDLCSPKGIGNGNTIRIGEKDYSIKAKDQEELRDIQNFIQLASQGTSLESIEDLSHRIHFLSSVAKVQTHSIHHLGLTTLNKKSVLSEWSQQEKALKRQVGEAYWKSKIEGKNQVEDAENFLGFLEDMMHFDPSIDLYQEGFLEKLALAISAKSPEKRDKGLFLSVFECLPLALVKEIDQAEGVDAFPCISGSNPQKKIFTESDLEQLQTYMKEVHFSGVVCLSDSKKTTHLFSGGEISSENIPFCTHSIGKMFTGMLAMKMLEKGFLSKDHLESPIYLLLDPEVIKKLPQEIQLFLSKQDAPTLHQVLTHKSGLGDYLNAYQGELLKAADHQANGLSDQFPFPLIEFPEDFLKYAEIEIYPLQLDGTHYSNFGLLLAGLSLHYLYNKEHSNDKKSYRELLQALVLDEANLSSFNASCPSIGCYNEQDPIARHIQGGPAGGYWMNAMDLLKFGNWAAEQCQNFTFYEIVKEYGKEFTKEYRDKISSDKKHLELQHAGDIISSSAYLGTFLSNGITIAILSNRPRQATGLEIAIKQHILSKPFLP